MEINELIKILNYVKEKYPKEKLYVSCYGGWEWNILGEITNIGWDRDKTNTFEDFKKTIDKILSK